MPKSASTTTTGTTQQQEQQGTRRRVKCVPLITRNSRSDEIGLDGAAAAEVGLPAEQICKTTADTADLCT